MRELSRVTTPPVRIVVAALTLVVTQAAAGRSEASLLAPIWNGAYIGLHGGASWGDVDASGLGAFDTTRALFGGHAGYNIALGNLVVGVEGDINYQGSSTTVGLAGGGSAALEVDWTGSLRGRVGYAIGPALFFATAGWTWAGTSLVERSAAGTTGKGNETFTGLVYGVGAEGYVLPSISLRLEALRYDYGTDRLSLAGGLTALREIEQTDTVVRLGVTLHFK